MVRDEWTNESAAGEGGRERTPARANDRLGGSNVSLRIICRCGFFSCVHFGMVIVVADGSFFKLFSGHISLRSIGRGLSLAIAAWDFRSYKLGTSVKIPKTRAAPRIRKFERSVEFDKIRPAASKSAFEVGANSVFARDSFMRSEIFDNHLMACESIPLRIGPSSRFQFFSENSELRDLQLKYIVARVRDSRVIPTTNDIKCGTKFILGNINLGAELRKVG